MPGPHSTRELIVLVGERLPAGEPLSVDGRHLLGPPFELAGTEDQSHH